MMTLYPESTNWNLQAGVKYIVFTEQVCVNCFLQFCKEVRLVMVTPDVSEVASLETYFEDLETQVIFSPNWTFASP